MNTATKTIIDLLATVRTLEDTIARLEAELATAKMTLTQNTDVGDVLASRVIQSLRNRGVWLTAAQLVVVLGDNWDFSEVARVLGRFYIWGVILRCGRGSLTESYQYSLPTPG